MSKIRIVSPDSLNMANATHADIYLSGGTVEYRGSIPANAGRNVIEIAGLSVTDPSRIQMRFSGGVSSCHVLGFETVKLETTPARKELEKKIRDTREAIDILSLQYEAWKKSADAAEPGAYAEQMEKAIESLPSRLRQNRSEAHKKEEVLEDLLAELEKATEGEIKALPLLRAEIFAESEGICHYSILADDDVRWEPFYEINVENIEKPLTARLRATICRNGGKDWDGISLKLIYGNKNREGTRPTLRPWTLSTQPAQRPLMRMAVAKSAVCEDMAMPMMGAGAAMSFAAPPAPQTEVNTDMLSQYILPGTYHVEEGANTVLDVLETAIPATYLYSAVPKLDADVFLTATVEKPETYNLLPCEAFVTYDHLSVGTVQIPKETSGEPFVLSLGRDQGVLVKRERTANDHSEAALTGRQTKKMSYTIRVTNHKDIDIPLEIKDQLPISEDDKIRVTAQDISGAALKEETGELTWKFTPLKAGSTATRTLAFTITYPKNVRI